MTNAVDQEAGLFRTLGVSDDDFDDCLVIGSQESAAITPTEGWNRVRGGGLGSGGWLARITGPDEKFGVAREFIDRDARGLSGSGASGTMTWDIPGDGIFEYRAWAASSRYPASGFVLVYAGKVASLGNRKKAVEKAVAGGDPLPPAEYRTYIAAVTARGCTLAEARAMHTDRIPLDYAEAALFAEVAA